MENALCMWFLQEDSKHTKPKIRMKKERQGQDDQKFKNASAKEKTMQRARTVNRKAILYGFFF